MYTFQFGIADTFVVLLPDRCSIVHGFVEFCFVTKGATNVISVSCLFYSCMPQTKVMEGQDINAVSRPKCDSVLHNAAEHDADVVARYVLVSPLHVCIPMIAQHQC